MYNFAFLCKKIPPLHNTNNVVICLWLNNNKNKAEHAVQSYAASKG